MGVKTLQEKLCQLGVRGAFVRVQTSLRTDSGKKNTLGTGRKTAHGQHNELTKKVQTDRCLFTQRGWGGGHR